MGCIPSKQELNALRAENKALKALRMNQGQPEAEPDVAPTGPCCAELSLEECLPWAEDYSPKRKDNNNFLQGWGIFKTSLERSKFIKCILLVLSSNGFYPISDYHMDLYFLRVGDKEFAYRATLCAMSSDNIVRRSLVGTQLGSDKKMAFVHLMFDIEEHFATILRNDRTHLTRSMTGSSARESELDLALLRAKRSSGISTPRRMPSYGSGVAPSQVGYHNGNGNASKRPSIASKRPSMRSLASAKSRVSQQLGFVGSTGPATYPACCPIPVVAMPNMKPHSKGIAEADRQVEHQTQLVRNRHVFQPGPGDSFLHGKVVERRMSAAQFQPPAPMPCAKPRALSMTQLSQVGTPQHDPREYFAKRKSNDVREGPFRYFRHDDTDDETDGELFAQGA